MNLRFDSKLEERVLQAVRSIQQLPAASADASPAALQRALQLSPREWARLGQPVMEQVKAILMGSGGSAGAGAGAGASAADPRALIVLVGIPGAGKSYFSKHLMELNPNWVRINQDEMGSRKACEQVATTTLKKKPEKSLLIDRTNIDVWQRSVWTGIAKK